MAKLTVNLHLKLYEKMLLIRRSEDKIIQHYHEDEMKTPMHMSRGGEHIAVGTISALGDRAQVSATYRTHAVYLALSDDTDTFFGELYGKDTGCAHGKAGSMHLLNFDKGLICTTAIVGTNIPVGVGAAYANKMQGNDKIVLIFFGDGAMDEGVFWESVNFACLKRLPVIFVYEDNGYAVHSPRTERHNYESVAYMMAMFGCHTVMSRSTDVEEIFNLTCELVKTMERSNAIGLSPSPGFMHLQYYRYLEHVGVHEDFEAGYRSEEEYQEWLERDCIKIQRQKLFKLMDADDNGVVEIENQVREKVLASCNKAKIASFPSREKLIQGVYSA